MTFWEGKAFRTTALGMFEPYNRGRVSAFLSNLCQDVKKILYEKTGPHHELTKSCTWPFYGNVFIETHMS